MTGGMLKVPLVIRLPSGGGSSSAAQHSQTWEALYTHIPGLKVIMPSTSYDAKGLLKSSIRDDNPIIFIETKKLYNQRDIVPEEEYLVPLGKAEVRRKGDDITIIALARMVNCSLQVAKVLEEEGISTEVIDPRTLIPLDEDTIINSVKKTHRALIVHEACRTSGFGAEIAARIAEKAFDHLDAPVMRIGTLDCPIPFNPRLEDYVIPNEHNIWAAAMKTMNKEFKEYPGERSIELSAR
jgi:pyruvate/2-oxoglutarate/acetoin dehydrogenase E1 component